MRLSYIAPNKVAHHVVAAWTYAATLHGIIACGHLWPPGVYLEDLREVPATCLLCAVSPKSRRDTTYDNEDA